MRYLRVTFCLSLMGLTVRTAHGDEPLSASASALVTAKKVDRLIDTRLADEAILASPLAGDTEFARRLYLDLIGRIPARSELLAFLKETATDKRAALIDALLEHEEYGQHFGRVWAERLAGNESVRVENRTAFAVWLAEQFSDNRPWGEVVEQIITARDGHPATAFVLDNLDDSQPRLTKLAASASQRFLGLQLQCAQCHDHPYEDWKQTEFWGLAAFFSRTMIKEVKTNGKKVKHVLEIATGPPKTRFGALPIELKDNGMMVLPEDAGPGAGSPVPPALLGAQAVSFPAEGSVRPQLAQWLVAKENPYFARATVNRWWADFFGRGLVNPVDDMEPSIAPTHPKVLALLVKDFSANGHDLKQLVRVICNTNAYQRTVAYTPGNEKDDRYYSRSVVRVLSPPALYRSLRTAWGEEKVPKSKVGLSLVEERQFREVFLKSADQDPTDFVYGVPQVLALLNSEVFFKQVPFVVDQIAKQYDSNSEAVDALFQSVLCRNPTDNEERAAFVRYIESHSDRSKGLSGIWWVLINSDEFIVY